MENNSFDEFFVECHPKYCPYCDGTMERAYSSVLEGFVWTCSHCTENHGVFIYYPKPIILPPKECREKFSTFYYGGRAYHDVWMEHRCACCDNPAEIIDSVYHIYNCPNCHQMPCGGNFRVYDSDGKEIRELREYTSFYDPNASEEDE